jgi:hypothetical protein
MCETRSSESVGCAARDVVKAIYERFGVLVMMSPRIALSIGGQTREKRWHPLVDT